ncbi:response regulator transcription factor [Burkholderia cepacia]|uniref:response regulator transcription factor n=1 Tax=Burkholderia cepacia TaxID=292 RepID=UPI001CF52C32|nr:response regulator transcription factor [Burkholderia cepacia]MCA8318576.1 response regulator transcription factor [Burkholderia cepacia]
MLSLIDVSRSISQSARLNTLTLKQIVMRIAILGSDKTSRDFVEEALVRVGYTCETFSSGREIIRQLRCETYDLIILDWLLSDMSGEAVMRWAHESLPMRIPVIFLSKRRRDEDLIRMLAAGADAYLQKPISPDLLAAHVGALARRIAAGDLKSKVRIREFEFDLRNKVIMANGKYFETTPKEFDIALLLFSNIGRSMSRRCLVDIVWRRDSAAVSRTVDTHVSNIRTKLRLNPDNGYTLRPIYGFGYILSLAERDS